MAARADIIRRRRTLIDFRVAPQTAMSLIVSLITTCAVGVTTLPARLGQTLLTSRVHCSLRFTTYGIRSLAYLKNTWQGNVTWHTWAYACFSSSPMLLKSTSGAQGPARSDNPGMPFCEDTANESILRKQAQRDITRHASANQSGI